jgi:hypothetical protein
MIYVSGRCQDCQKYYELPRQEREASAYLNLQDDGMIRLTIICNNAILCRERQHGQPA